MGTDRTRRTAGRIGLACVLLLPLIAAAQEKASPLFPMTKGTTWIYAAHVKAAQPNSDQILEADVRWTMTVLDSTEDGRVSAALLRGSPWDLSWYTPDTRPQEFLIVRAGADYYLVHARVREWFDTFRRGLNDEPEDELASDLWFRTPLNVYDAACPPDIAQDLQPMYCWSVEDIVKDSKSNVKGLKRINSGYLLAQRTNPEHVFMTLVPGVGITSWVYAHHGTTSEAELRLIEFHKR